MTGTIIPPPRLRENPSAAERHHAGRSRRAALPREALACTPHTDPLEAVRRLAQEDTGRQPDLLTERYARLLQSPFSYMRGSAGVMAADLATQPRTGLHAQLCGDAHLGNFGVFATPERRLVFDVNDFDETLTGPFEWDLKRLVTSVALAGRANGHSRREREHSIAASAATYRQAMQASCEEPTLAVWYRTVTVEDLVHSLGKRAPKSERRDLKRTLRRALAEDASRTVDRLTCFEDGRRRFISKPPALVRLVELHPDVTEGALWGEALEVYNRYLTSLADDRLRLVEMYTPVDVARKAVGVGSYGLEAYVLLLQGPAPQDVLILQVKEAGPSVLEAYFGPSGFEHHGERVVSGQRRIQAASDALLGWQWRSTPALGTTDFYVRQLRDGKLSADLESMDPERLRVHAQLCGWTLAKAHARSGDRFAIAGYLGTDDVVDEALTYFAEQYADCVTAQHAAVRASRALERDGAAGR